LPLKTNAVNEKNVNKKASLLCAVAMVLYDVILTS